MALIKSVKEWVPQFGKNVYLAENATVLGNVVMGDDCSIWFNTVLRGDVNGIRIGNKVNVQDGAVIHGTFGRNDTIVGNNVTIGHRAIIHGCTIQDNALIGMGAIILDDAIICENAVVAAGAVVLSGVTVPSGSIYGGIPAKRVGSVSDSFASGELEAIANAYVKYASWYA